MNMQRMPKRASGDLQKSLKIRCNVRRAYGAAYEMHARCAQYDHLAYNRKPVKFLLELITPFRGLLSIPFDLAASH